MSDGDLGLEVQERAVGLVGLDDHPLARCPTPRSACGRRRAAAARRRPRSRPPRRTPPARARSSPWSSSCRACPRPRSRGASTRPRRAARRGGARAASRAPPRPRAGRRESRWRRPARCRRARARRRGRPAARCRPRAARRSTASRRASQPLTSAPSACAISASPLIPAPPMPTKCSLRPRQGASSGGGCGRSASPAADSTSAAIRCGGVGARDRARGFAPSAPSRAGSPSSSSTCARSRAAISSSSAITTAAPASAIQRAFLAWWSAVACGYGTRIAGLPAAAISKTEPPARATTRSHAASGSAERVQVLDHPVAGPVADALAHLARSRACP